MSLILKIVEYEPPESPRTAYDNVGIMLCSHRRYAFGDEQINSDNYNSWREVASDLCKDAAVVLPLYVYDHSGLSMSTKPFNCRWDSGQVGWIYCTKEKAIKEWGRKYLTKNVVNKAAAYLRSEVETYSQYLSGDVWGYVIEDDETGEEVESCWGFYGHEDCEQEGEACLKALTGE